MSLQILKSLLDFFTLQQRWEDRLPPHTLTNAQTHTQTYTMPPTVSCRYLLASYAPKLQKSLLYDFSSSPTLLAYNIIIHKTKKNKTNQHFGIYFTIMKFKKS